MMFDVHTVSGVRQKEQYPFLGIETQCHSWETCIVQQLSKINFFSSVYSATLARLPRSAPCSPGSPLSQTWGESTCAWQTRGCWGRSPSWRCNAQPIGLSQTCGRFLGVGGGGWCFQIEYPFAQKCTKWATSSFAQSWCLQCFLRK